MGVLLFFIGANGIGTAIELGTNPTGAIVITLIGAALMARTAIKMERKEERKYRKHSCDINRSYPSGLYNVRNI